MKKLLILIIFTFFCIIFKGQTTYFEKIIQGPVHDYLTCIESINDGKYIVCGSYGITVAEHAIYVAKLDIDGNFIWQNKFTHTNDIIANHIVQCKDKGFLICGMMYNINNHDAFALKLDSLGNYKWCKSFGTVFEDQFLRSKQTPDNGFIFTGYLTDSGKDVFLLKTDSIGNLQWSNSFSRGYGDEEGWSAFQSNDGGYILCGYTFNYPFGFYVIKTTNVGNPVWAKKYGNNLPIEPYGDAQPTPENGFMLTGAITSYSGNNRDAFLMKIDSTGNINWSKKYGDNDYDAGRYIFPTHDGGYILPCNTQSFGSPNVYSLVIKTDPTGNVMWSKAGGIGISSNPNGIIQSSDRGYIISANELSGSSANDTEEMYIIKTDSLGNGSCNFYDTPVFDSIFTLPVSNTTFTATIPTLILGNYSLAVSGGDPITTLCSNVGVKESVERQEIKLFPNPSNGLFKLINLNKDCKIEIFNMFGTMVYSTICSDSEINVDILKVTTGFYFYKISEKDQTVKPGKFCIEQ